jgi:Ion channel
VPLDIVIGIAGVVVVMVTAGDVFQSVIVPRPTYAWRPSALISRGGWRIIGAIGMRITNSERREAVLGVYAPLLLVTLMIFWVTALTLGFGLIFFALRGELKPEPQTYWAAVYYAGTSLLTLGYGDFIAQRGLARAISLAAAAVGLGTFAIVTAFLFSLFAAFQRREAFIVTMRERTGAPPSGVDFIERYVELDMLDDLAPTFRRAEEWIADIMETHLAYPVLSYFRSTHDEQSWVGTLGAFLDASTIVITTVDIGRVGPARMLSRLGRHLVIDYAFYFEYNLDRTGGGAVGIDRAEFDQVYERLRAKGLRMREPEVAWVEFAALRGTYAVALNIMARWWRIPPALWIGDRSLITSRHVPSAPVRSESN